MTCMTCLGFYIRFLSTLHHLEEALDEYAGIPPDFLAKNVSITSELVTGMYNGEYLEEVVRFVDYLEAIHSFEKMDSMNYSRIMTENLKAKAKLGRFEDLQGILDHCFQKHLLFLPLSYAEIISVGFSFIVFGLDWIGLDLINRTSKEVMSGKRRTPSLCNTTVQ